ncbi:uncharacterized protein LODBEIA_P46410 [Lodderomyces beijingensis]|uniref:Homing endonuclease LAGLIDADG domain-containing protein n=1 Tax=Lodderomyces beijingensis TaxID=1775926 RepID=A0ABP0ZSU1_9ASCO
MVSALSIIGVLLLALFVVSYKTVPLAYPVRFYFQVIRSLGASKFFTKQDATKHNTWGFRDGRDLFKFVDLKSSCSLLELDFYLHKSNSTFFFDLDIARTKLLTQVFQQFWWYAFENRDGKMGKGQPYAVANFPYTPVAAVQCQFKRELKLFEKFTIKSRVLAWDQKWLFILSVFTTKDRKNKEKVNAYALTKYVFKNGRQTIPPPDILKHCNLLDEKSEAINKVNYELVRTMVETENLEALVTTAI